MLPGDWLFRTIGRSAFSVSVQMKVIRVNYFTTGDVYDVARCNVVGLASGPAGTFDAIEQHPAGALADLALRMPRADHFRRYQCSPSRPTNSVVGIGFDSIESIQPLIGQRDRIVDPKLLDKWRDRLGAVALDQVA